MKKELLCFLCPVAFLFFAGCAGGGSQGARSSSQMTSEQAVVKDIFWEWRNHIINNNWDKAYSLTSQTVKNSYNNNFQTWKLDYETSAIKDHLKDIVEIKQVGIGDDGMATVVVEMRDKTKILWTAANEMGRWRVEKVIPPR